MLSQSIARRPRLLAGRLLALAAMAAGLLPTWALAQNAVTTAFTYQGELARDGSPAAGLHDFRFRLLDAPAAGTQVGPTLCVDDLDVSNGRFTVSLDFGPQFSDQKRYLEVLVRPDAGLGCADATGFATITPRQELTAAPYAAAALSAQTAATLGGLPPAHFNSAGNLTGTLPSSALAGPYAGVLSLTNPGNTFVGSGEGLFFLDAGNIAFGTLSAERMPIDWPAGGDLQGTFPSPTIAPGAVTDAKIRDVAWFKITGVPENVRSASSPWQTQVLTPTAAIAWGSNTFDRNTIPPLPPGVLYTAVSEGFDHSLALRSDGQVVAWGSDQFGNLDVPPLDPGTVYTAVAACAFHSLALRSDGMVVAWGRQDLGQTQVPELPPGLVYTGLGGGSGLFSLAVRSDGAIVQWGAAPQNVRPLPTGVTYIAASAGFGFGMGLRSDGTVVTWGSGLGAQPALPAGVRYTAIAGGGGHAVALRSDGQVVVWGNNSNGQASVPPLPAGLVYTAIASVADHILALRSDGMVVGWGSMSGGATTPLPLPPGATYTAIAAGRSHSLALYDTHVLRYDGAALITGHAEFNGPVTASAFSGDGAALSNLNASLLDGQNASFFTNAANISGNGAAITNVDAARLGGQPPSFYTDASSLGTGILPTARLGPNVPRLDTPNAFGSFTNTFAGSVGIGTATPAEPLSVAGVIQSLSGGFKFPDGSVQSTANRWSGNAPSAGTEAIDQSAFGHTGSTTLLVVGQSFTAGVSGRLTAVRIWTGSNNIPVFFEIRQGDGQSGAPLYGISTTLVSAGGSALFQIPTASAPILAAGQQYTFVVSSMNMGTPINFFFNNNLYPGGRSLNASTVDMDFQTFVTTGYHRGDIVTDSFIGINTVNPTNRLSVNGNADVSGSLSVGSLSAGSLSGNGAALTNLNAALLGGEPPAFYRSAANISGSGAAITDVNAAQLDGQPASFYTNAANISGSGANITGVNAATLAGQPPSAYARTNAANAFGNFTNTFAGNVGIGAAAPLIGLDLRLNDIIGTSATSVGQHDVSNRGTKSSFGSIVAATPSEFVGMRTLIGPSTQSGGGNTGDIRFDTWEANTSTSREVARITGRGNLGLGTATPATRLHVQSSNYGIQHSDGTRTLASFLSSVSNSAQLGTRTNHPLGFFVNDAAPSVFISTNGFLGIGTASPSTQFGCVGNGSVTGSFSKGSGTFKIDHPLDPENKFLYHSFVESPDMKNIYDGTAITDDRGYATITLPAYFEALNSDFRYQLTVLDEADADDVLLWAKVVRKIGTEAPNQFTIRTARPGLEVSWQVTGIRKDAFANHNRVIPEVEKSPAEKGKFLHPDAFDQPDAKAIFPRPAPREPAAVHGALTTR